MKVKVTCITPKGQAEKAQKKLKNNLFVKVGKIAETKMVNDSLFYWIVDIEQEEKIEVLVMRAVKAEAAIRKSYKRVMRVLYFKKNKIEDWAEMTAFLKKDLITVEMVKK